MTRIATLALIAAPTFAQRTLAPADMEADLFQMSDQLLGQHSGLYRYASPEEIDEAFGEALYAVSEERSPLDFYRTVSRLISTVRCGHTRAIPSREVLDEAQEERGLLPFEVLLAGERAFILHSFDGALPQGAELLSIDGRSIADIRASAFALMNSDGFIETGKQRHLERRFARMYALLVQQPDDRGPFVIQLVGHETPLSVEGLSGEALEAAATVRDARPLIDLVLRPDDDLALLSIASFGDPALGDSFPVQLAHAFERVQASGIGHLALDLRGNGGGNDMYGALTVSYFSPEPFGYFDHISVTADYDGEGGIVERDGERLVTAHPGTEVQQPSSPGFRGEAYVLMDGWTFSTAADVATVMHHNGLATFVGEECGGGYDGNTSGMTRRRDLVNSRIAFTCPLWCYTTANVGHELSLIHI